LLLLLLLSAREGTTASPVMVSLMPARTSLNASPLLIAGGCAGLVAGVAC